jgi:hypothetical protein
MLLRAACEQVCSGLACFCLLKIRHLLSPPTSLPLRRSENLSLLTTSQSIGGRGGGGSYEEDEEPSTGVGLNSHNSSPTVSEDHAATNAEHVARVLQERLGLHSQQQEQKEQLKQKAQPAMATAGKGQ